MTKIRFYILDDKLGEEYKLHLDESKKKMGIEATIHCGKIPFKRLPRDYDGYYLHLSNTTEQEIESLREDQPWCKIFTRTGFHGHSMLKEVDGEYYLKNTHYLNDMLEETAKIYQEK